MSLLGPKMRYHSKAPWEIEGPLEEDDEETDSILSRGKERMNFGFRDRSSSVTRPSGESSRSQVNPKRSFETTSSRTSHFQ